MSLSQKIKISILFVICLGLTGCPWRKQSIELHLKSYIEMQKEFVNVIQKEVGLNTDNYRITAIPPMVETYQPGTLLTMGSYEPITDACLLANLVHAPVGSTPAISSNRTFTLDAGMPAILAEAIREIVDIRSSVKATGDAMFSYSDLNVVNPRQDEFEKAMQKKECREKIAGKDILMIRGIYYGKESVHSKKTFSSSATVRLIKNDTLTVKYDSSGGYEVKDTNAAPKFWIVTIPHFAYAARSKEYRKSSFDEPAVMEKAPPDEVLDELYAAINNRANRK